MEYYTSEPEQYRRSEHDRKEKFPLNRYRHQLHNLVRVVIRKSWALKG